MAIQKNLTHLKSKTFLLSLFFISSFISGSAYAAFYLEPYVSKELGQGKGSAEVTSPVALTMDFDDSIDGLVYGAKLAYSLVGYGVGADISIGDITIGDDDEFHAQDLGAFLQIRFANRWRFSATYFLNAKLEADDGDFSGTGIKAGLGYVFLKHASVHVDYTTINYDDGTSGSLHFNSVDFDRNSFQIGVSFPYEI